MIRLASARFAALSLTLLAGCSTQPSPFTGFFEGFGSCRDEYAKMDARVAAAGVGDGAYYRVPGYPYLRTDRLLASYAHELEGFEQNAAWLRRMREFDQEARQFEYYNLGMTLNEIGVQRDRFLNCGRTLAGIELDDPVAFENLKDAVQPPDEYSGVARTFCLYALMVPVIQKRLDAQREAVVQEFAKPIESLDSAGPLALWSVKPREDAAEPAFTFRKTVPDEFGLPGLSEGQWQALAERHAPSLWIETAGEQDLPGAPRWSEAGPDVDSSRPLVNYTISFGRFGAEPVMQITYFVWFHGATGATAPIDGQLWRVSLDMDARPIAYESLHASGRSHYWFPVQPLARREHRDGVRRQPGLVPQDAVPATRPALRLQAGTHALRRVVPAEDARAERNGSYELRRYEDLYVMPLPKGGTRSLFGPDGVIAGSGGHDPLWMWSTGVRNPGVLKQYGRQTPAYIGREHFDEPFLLESVFVAPAPAPG